MLRIGIVGSDNSHAIAYSKLANIDKVAGEQCRVVGICGQEPERTREVAEQGQIDTIVETPRALLDLVDAALVVDRHGDSHADHALPFLERGIPVYVDKPFAIRLEDCERMLATARRSGALLTSFSALRFAPTTEDLARAVEGLGEVRAAHFAGPCDFESQYGGPFFYATHVAEIALRLLGEDVETLRAVRSGRTVAVQVMWSNGTLATFTYLGDGEYHFHATLFGTGGMAAREITGGDSSYAEGLKVVLRMIETGERPFTDEQLLRPIAMVHAVQKSLGNGGEEINLSSLVQRHGQ